jgi:gamma-glutamylcyclotransferase
VIREAAIRLYFAYGSNLLDTEIGRDVPSAEFKGIGYVAGHSLVFNKHTQTRGGDAANIVPQPDAQVWGCLYRMDEKALAALKRRERGYVVAALTAHRITGHNDASQPTDVFTFLAERTCEKRCGPSRYYLNLIIGGAKQRGLPNHYIRWLQSIKTRGS